MRSDSTFVKHPSRHATPESCISKGGISKGGQRITTVLTLLSKFFSTPPSCCEHFGMLVRQGGHSSHVYYMVHEELAILLEYCNARHSVAIEEDKNERLELGSKVKVGSTQYSETLPMDIQYQTPSRFVAPCSAMAHSVSPFSLVFIHSSFSWGATSSATSSLDEI
jgi:hypothetical protein